MTRKIMIAFLMLATLLASLIGSTGVALADDATETATEETPATATPTVATPVPGEKFFTHPVVKMLSEYFDQETGEPDPEATPVANESGLGPIGEKIAAYHEQGMGFGVLVKIFALVKASEEACAAEGAPADCTPLTDDELVTMFKEEGMGALFKEYGKPALLGVGHVRKDLKAQEKATCVAADPSCDQDMKQDKNKDKNQEQDNKPEKTPKPTKDKHGKKP